MKATLSLQKKRFGTIAKRRKTGGENLHRVFQFVRLPDFRFTKAGGKGHGS